MYCTTTTTTPSTPFFLNIKAYYHEYFLRGKSRLCKLIHSERVKGTGKRKSANGRMEPNLYSYIYLPEHNSNSNSSTVTVTASGVGAAAALLASSSDLELEKKDGIDELAPHPVGVALFSPTNSMRKDQEPYTGGGYSQSDWNNLLDVISDLKSPQLASRQHGTVAAVNQPSVVISTLQNVVQQQHRYHGMVAAAVKDPGMDHKNVPLTSLYP